MGNQRCEVKVILKTLLIGGGWKNHPAVKMWNGYTNALSVYYNTILDEWIGRGYKNNMPYIAGIPTCKMPPWLGDEQFHASHRSKLLSKNHKYYSQFGWKEPNDLPYVWPRG